MKRVRAKDLSDLIMVLFGDNVSDSTLLRLRRRYPIALPATDEEVRQWWPRVCESEKRVPNRTDTRSRAVK